MGIIRDVLSGGYMKTQIQVLRPKNGKDVQTQVARGHPIIRHRESRLPSTLARYISTISSSNTRTVTRGVAFICSSMWSAFILCC